jgi:hypothetical protein
MFYILYEPLITVYDGFNLHDGLQYRGNGGRGTASQESEYLHGFWGLYDMEWCGKGCVLGQSRLCLSSFKLEIVHGRKGQRGCFRVRPHTHAMHFSTFYNMFCDL